MVSTLTLTPMWQQPVDHNGGLLGVESFPADASGFEELVGKRISKSDFLQVYFFTLVDIRTVYL